MWRQMSSARLVLAAALLLATGAGARAQDLADKKNLIEYSCDYFGEGGVDFGFVKPPEIKIYQDGTIVFRRDWQYFIGQISPRQLELTRDKLRRSTLLRESAYHAEMRGKPMLHHGGFCHFRYLEDASRLVAAPVVPRRGKWRRLVDHLRAQLPETAEPYLPAKLILSAEAVRRSGRSAQSWTHGDQLELAAAAAQPVEVTDPDVVHTVFTGTHKLFVHADRVYRIDIIGSPGWFDPASIEKRLLRLAEP